MNYCLGVDTGSINAELALVHKNGRNGRAVILNQVRCREYNCALAIAIGFFHHCSDIKAAM
jgi:hypothetical protein